MLCIEDMKGVCLQATLPTIGGYVGRPRPIQVKRRTKSVAAYYVNAIERGH